MIGNASYDLTNPVLSCIAQMEDSVCGVNHTILWTPHAKLGYYNAVEAVLLFGKLLRVPAWVPWYLMSPPSLVPDMCTSWSTISTLLLCASV